MSKTLSPIEAIQAYCRECEARFGHAYGDCQQSTCPHWYYRTEEMSDKTLASHPEYIPGT